MSAPAGLRVGDRRLRADRRQARRGARPERRARRRHRPGRRARGGARRRATAGGRAPMLDELLALEPDVVIVATTHDQLAPLAERALEAGAHVLVEKPGGLGTAQIERLIDGCRATPGGSSRSASTTASTRRSARAGRRGALRARTASSCTCAAATATAAGSATTASGGPSPARSGGGELIDQGMHLLDLTHWLAGPLPLHSALLRTHFWDTRGRGQRRADPRGRATSRHGAVGDAARDLDRVEEHVLARDLLPDGEAPGRRPRALLRPADAADLPHAPGARAAGARGARRIPTRIVRGRPSGSTSPAAIGAGEPVLGEPRRRPLRVGHGWRTPTRDSPVYAGLAAALKA